VLQVWEDQVKIYERYAEVYDRVGQPGFSLRMAKFTLGLLERAGLENLSILDLACGTGAAALHFARAGHRVTGVDSAAAMLAQARRKTDSQKDGPPVTFLEQDMRSFHVDGPMDLVTCFYDSLNYLLHPEELQEVFVRVASVLAPGGLLVCDLNTVLGLTRDWGGHLYLAADDQDLFGVHHANYDDVSGIGSIHLIFFVRQGESWQRFDETHRQRGYDQAEVEHMLKEAGLEVLSTRDGGLGSSRPDSNRIIYVASKQNPPAALVDT
jgi:ubiquinone/menaquinone biosynthesis C-methylase UbiE